MDLRQIEYIIAIEQEQSISKAAEKLFITQSALNQQLLRLERTLGIVLFERRNHGMVPTYAGKIYLAAAHQMIEMRNETYKVLRDISEEQAGEISIAHTPERGALMFSNIYPLFHEKYPKVVFRIHEARVKKMEQMLLQRQVTMAFLTHAGGVKHPDLEYVDMKEELMILGLPISHPLAHLAGEKSWDSLPQLDLKLLQDEPFVLPAKETRIRDMVDRAFLLAGYRPKVLFEASNSLTLLNMVRNQQCASFFPQSYVTPSDQVVFFSVAPRESWMRGVAYLKGTYLTKPEQYLIELATQYNERLFSSD